MEFPLISMHYIDTKKTKHHPSLQYGSNSASSYWNFHQLKIPENLMFLKKLSYETTNGSSQCNVIFTADDVKVDSTLLYENILKISLNAFLNLVQFEEC